MSFLAKPVFYGTRNIKVLTVVFFLMLLVRFDSAYAHHSHANLDRENILVNKGTVVKYGWSMPHVYIKVDAPNPQGKIVRYSIEMIHPPGMLERGWTRRSLKKGDVVTWSGASDKNPSRYYSGLNWLEKSDGTRLTLKLHPEAVIPSRDFSGLWSRHLSVPKRYLPQDDWPFTALAKENIAKFDGSQTPLTDCINPGPPKATILPYPMKIIRNSDNTMTIIYEGRNIPRTIYFDKNHLAGAPSVQGHSVAWFEGEELVIETDNFIADRWGTYTGVDSSDQKHLMERLSLSKDGLAITIEMLVTDPVYLTEPVTIMHKVRKLADRELVTAACTTESAKMYLTGE